MVGGEIKVVMTLDDKDFSIKTVKAEKVISDLKRTLDQTASSVKNIESKFQGFGHSFRMLTLNISLVRFALQDVYDVFLRLPLGIVKTAGEIERMQKLMEGLSKETDDYRRKAEAAAGVKFVFNMAQNAPFNVKALTDTFVKFKTAGIDPTNGSMQALVDSVAKFGGSSEHLHRASIAIQQMSGKGVVSMEELRQQLGEAVPDAIKLMADGMGMSMGELVKHISNGEVGAKAALNRMLTVMAIDNKGAAQSMMETWSGMVEKLKTKWTLFQVEIANTGFFESMKVEISDFIDLFDTTQMKKFANTIGEALNSFVGGVREAIRLWNEYAAVIKIAGELFVAYFVGSKLRSFASAIGDSEAGKKFQEVRQKTIEAAREREAGRKKELESKIAFNEREIREGEEAIKREMANARAAQTQRANMIAAEAAARHAASAEKLAEYQRELNVARDMMMQKMALERQARSTDLRTETGRARHTLLLQEAEAARMAVAAANARATALNNEAAALTRAAVADEAKAAATRNSTVATTSDAAAIAAKNSILAQHVDSLKKQASATSGVTMATGMMKGAMAGARTIFAAFGGWVGIAVTALTMLVAKVYEFVNRWKEADAIVKRIKQGMADEKDAGEYQDRIAEQQKKVDALREKLNSKKSSTGSIAASAETEMRRRELEREEQELAKMKANHAEAITQINERSLNTETENFKRIMDRSVNTKLDSIRAANAKLEKEKEDALEKFRKNNPNATAEDEKKVVSDFINKQNANRQEFANWQRDYFRIWSNNLEQQIAQESSEAEKRVLEAKKKVIDEALLKNADELAASAEKFGLNDWKVASKNKQQSTDHLKDKATDLRARLAAARQELDNIMNEATTYADVRRKVEAEVRALWENDKLSIETPGENGKSTKVKHAWDSKEVQSYIDDQAAMEIVAKAKQHASQIKGKLGPIKEELKREMELYKAGDFTTKATGKAENSTIKILEKIAGSSSVAKAELEHVIKAMKELEHDSVMLDATVAARAAEHQASDIRISLLETEGERRKALQDEELKRLDEKNNATLEKVRAVGESTVEYEKTFAAQRKAIQDKHARDSETQLDKLARQWRDVTEQMNQATAKWANGFVDMMVQGADTGKYEWKKMLRQWLLDLYRINLQATLGDVMKKAFSGAGDFLTTILSGGKQGDNSIGKFFEGIFGGISKESDTVTNALKTLTEQGVNESTKGMIESVSKMVTKSAAETQATSSLLYLAQAAQSAATALMNVGGGGIGGLLGGIPGLGDFGWVGSEGVGEALPELSGAIDGIPFLFANGGIMTEFGAVALRKYAAGGIANRPQLAMFGEGSTPEAYVPLPDGRSIPVTMQGGMGNNVTIQIVINEASGQENSQEESDGGSDVSVWRDLAERVKGVVQQELAVQSRPGGMLYK